MNFLEALGKANELIELIKLLMDSLDKLKSSNETLGQEVQKLNSEIETMKKGE